MAAYKSHEYLINEGNQLGYLPAEFGSGNGNPLTQKKIVAGGDIKKGQVVELTDELTVEATTAASANVLGVAMFDAKEGEPVGIETEGLFKLTANATITAPALIESAADGKVATKGATVTKIIGLALTDASADGDVYVKFSI